MDEKCEQTKPFLSVERTATGPRHCRRSKPARTSLHVIYTILDDESSQAHPKFYSISCIKKFLLQSGFWNPDHLFTVDHWAVELSRSGLDHKAILGLNQEDGQPWLELLELGLVHLLGLELVELVELELVLRVEKNGGMGGHRVGMGGRRRQEIWQQTFGLDYHLGMWKDSGNSILDFVIWKTFDVMYTKCYTHKDIQIYTVESQ